MQAKVYLNQPLTQDRYGLHFEKGEALCENEYIIKKLQTKGVKVEIIKEEKPDQNPGKKEIDEMTIAELKKYATENNIEIPSKAKSKTDIVEFIKNYKEEDESPEAPQGNNGEDESPIINSNDANSEEDKEEKNEEEPKSE